MTKAERLKMAGELVTMLLGCERYEEQDVMNKYAPQNTGERRDVRLALWAAREVLRKQHQVDFAPVRGFPEVFQRAPWDLIERRSRRQRAAGRRKERRALERLLLAASLAPEKEKARLEKEIISVKAQKATLDLVKTLRDVATQKKAG